MRKLLVAVVVLVMVGGWAPAWGGSDQYDDYQSHPLRVAAYLLHPVGYTLEWLVFRPFHALVSQPDLEPLSGHREHRGHIMGGTAARRPARY